eukprot:2965322-Alexandrium_andersonii.AAC.1
MGSESAQLESAANEMRATLEGEPDVAIIKTKFEALMRALGLAPAPRRGRQVGEKHGRNRARSPRARRNSLSRSPRRLQGEGMEWERAGLEHPAPGTPN